MNKKALLMTREELRKRIESIDLQLAIMENGLQLTDNEKSFEKFNLNEMNDLYTINEKAFKYLQAHPTETVADYNGTVPKDDRIIFAE